MLNQNFESVPGVFKPSWMESIFSYPLKNYVSNKISTTSKNITQYLIKTNTINYKDEDKTIKDLCKFYIPCLFQYSSFGQNEKKIFSLTYGIWLIIFTIVSLGYYFILGSENYELETYFRNNKSFIPTAFLTTSWNFNYIASKLIVCN